MVRLLEARLEGQHELGAASEATLRVGVQRLGDDPTVRRRQERQVRLASQLGGRQLPGVEVAVGVDADEKFGEDQREAVLVAGIADESLVQLARRVTRVHRRGLDARGQPEQLGQAELQE